MLGDISTPMKVLANSHAEVLMGLTTHARTMLSEKNKRKSKQMELDEKEKQR
jgi:hypothetical protein